MSHVAIEIPYVAGRAREIFGILSKPLDIGDTSVQYLSSKFDGAEKDVYRNGRTSVVIEDGRLRVIFVGSAETANKLKEYAKNISR